MTTVCEKTIRAAIAERYLTSHDEQCDDILDAVQRLSKYNGIGLAQHIDIVRDYDALRKEAELCAETGDQLLEERPLDVTRAEATQTMLWLKSALDHVSDEDKPAVESLRKVISESQHIDVDVQASTNDLLYEKLQDSQDKYRKWLNTLPVQDALEHNYDYTIREEILSCVATRGDLKSCLDEDLLTDEQAQALLQCDDPLSDICNHFKENDPKYMDGIIKAIRGQAQVVMASPRQSVGVYQM